MKLLKEIRPRLSRVAVLGSSEVFFNEAAASARVLGIQLLGPLVQGPDDIHGAFRTITKERVNGILTRLQPSIFSVYYKRAAELTTRSRLPSIATNKSWVNAGGLMSYVSDLNFHYRCAATYVAKILKGAKPADLPIERPRKFELVINLKTAKEIGLTIPQSMLYRADRVIR